MSPVRRSAVVKRFFVRSMVTGDYNSRCSMAGERSTGEIKKVGILFSAILPKNSNFLVSD